MFGPNTPMRLVGCAGKQLRAGSDKRRVLVLSWQLQPFTAEMANDLNIKARLFASRDGEPLPDVISTTLAIAVAPQRVQIRMAPDQTKPSVELVAATLQPALTIRRDREGPVFSATVVIVADYPSGDNLLLLMQRVTEQFFVTLEIEQGDMLERAAQQGLVDADSGDDHEDLIGDERRAAIAGP